MAERYLSRVSLKDRAWLRDISAELAERIGCSSAERCISAELAGRSGAWPRELWLKEG